MKQIVGLACCSTMQNTEKFEPKDSVKNRKKSNQTAKKPQNQSYTKEEATLPNPEKKRKFSEQPPTKRNSKT